MKRHLFSALAMGLVLLLPTPAFACTPVPAKSWAGSIQIAKHSSTGVSNTVFANNKCEWPDPALNGFDAVVFDVASHKGLPGKVTWDTSTAVKPSSVFGYFRSASCATTGATWSTATSGQALDFTFPDDAKWLIVQPVTTVPSKDIAISVSSPGRKCPPPA
jgi:hypothetical protein